MAERLDKVLSSQNFGSRKEVGSLIRKGVVTVNGELVKQPDYKVNPEADTISVHGKPLFFERFVYYMMNKPGGVLSAARDSQAETVLDLLPPELARRGLFPAGRLDKDTEGLLIITDDGDFSHRMLAPKSGVEKVYHAVLDAPIEAADMEAFAQGLEMKDWTCLPARLRVLEEGENPLVEATVCEGKFHQVKRMFAARGKTVLFLKRVKIGNLELDPSLKTGEVRKLSFQERQAVFSRTPDSPAEQGEG
ncbi:MAG: rRNA pseudouridine synthase [Clostridiales bacterium]|jgi:16S rRNA pseudouridine516 synthase|nr:rRNA pseudouridine synthase [Clostridiales bacterium]